MTGEWIFITKVMIKVRSGGLFLNPGFPGHIF